VPSIPGLLETGFLDNISHLRLQALPQSLIIIGTGYIGCEFGHFLVSIYYLGAMPRVMSNRPPIPLHERLSGKPGPP
jgi:hypothetical protein